MKDFSQMMVFTGHPEGNVNVWTKFRKSGEHKTHARDLTAFLVLDLIEIHPGGLEMFQFTSHCAVKRDGHWDVVAIVIMAYWKQLTGMLSQWLVNHKVATPKSSIL